MHYGVLLKMESSNTEKLVGKLLLIYSMGQDMNHPTLLQTSSIEVIGGETFIVGLQPDSYCGELNWLGDIETYVSFRSVAQFHVFDNYEHFEEVSTNETGGLFTIFKKLK